MWARKNCWRCRKPTWCRLCRCLIPRSGSGRTTSGDLTRMLCRRWISAVLQVRGWRRWMPIRWINPIWRIIPICRRLSWTGLRFLRRNCMILILTGFRISRYWRMRPPRLFTVLVRQTGWWWLRRWPRRRDNYPWRTVSRDLFQLRIWVAIIWWMPGNCWIRRLPPVFMRQRLLPSCIPSGKSCWLRKRILRKGWTHIGCHNLYGRSLTRSIVCMFKVGLKGSGTG